MTSLVAKDDEVALQINEIESFAESTKALPDTLRGMFWHHLRAYRQGAPQQKEIQVVLDALLAGLLATSCNLNSG